MSDRPLTGLHRSKTTNSASSSLSSPSSGGHLHGQQHGYHTATPIPPLLQQRMAAFANRSGAVVNNAPNPAEFMQPVSTNHINHAADALRRRATGCDATSPLQTPPSSNSFPRPNNRSLGGTATSLAAKRMRPNLHISAIDPKLIEEYPAAATGLGQGRPFVSAVPPKRSSQQHTAPGPSLATPFANFSKIVYVPFLSAFRCSGYQGLMQIDYRDTSGALNFDGKAVLNASGVNFLNGKSFAIAMHDLILDEELGRGNYGTVKKVIHKPTKVAMAMKVRPFLL